MQFSATIGAAASSEQATGVVQVGQAVRPMDQATPQNAALVEEIAASSLKAQALAQRMAVLRFNLGKRLLTAASGNAHAWPGAPAQQCMTRMR